ncbi:glycosyltransferase family 39 protein [uncultured Draconibacterium sp.]|uniref:ArnT family glycosyltransferase n=1 Tax=uncultured Draconibacterium sp. TaxID=1573823 RepID=UPI003217BB7C
MERRKVNLETIVSVFIGAFLLLTYILGLFVPVTSDAGKYAAISRVIYETGDWVNLSVHFEPYLQKPPLLFWITAPFYFLLGPSEFAFKLPVLLYSAIAIYSTYRFAKLFYTNRVAKIAALMLATSEFYFLFHNDIHTDVLLTANVIFAIWQIAAYFRSYQLKHMLLAGLGIGLALISKGPIGIYVPVTATLTHVVFSGQLKKIFSYKIVLGAIVGLVVLFVGLIGLFKQFGWEGLNFFFWENNAGRISGRIKGGRVDYLFYFHTTLYIFLPWGLLFFLSVFSEFKELFKKANAELYSLGGIVFYWSVVSVAHAQAPHYLMVLSPFMAVLSAKWVVQFFENQRYIKLKKTVVVLQYVTIGFLWILMLVLCIYCFPATSLWFWAGIVFLVILFFIRTGGDNLSLVLRRSILSILVISFAINVHLFPTLFKYQSVITACEVFDEMAEEGEMLNTYLSQHRELFFYAKTPGYYLYDSEDLRECLTKQKGGWIYTNDKGLDEIFNSGAEVKLVQSFKHRSLSGFTAKFINPATREASLKNMHLIHIITPL